MMLQLQGLDLDETAPWLDSLPHPCPFTPSVFNNLCIIISLLFFTVCYLTRGTIFLVSALFVRKLLGNAQEKNKKWTKEEKGKLLVMWCHSSIFQLFPLKLLVRDCFNFFSAEFTLYIINDIRYKGLYYPSK